LKNFILGAASLLVFVLVVGFSWLFLGGMPMTTSGGPLPFEKAIAGIALHAAIGSAEELPSPITADELNLQSGAKVYKTNCAVCHGLMNQPSSAIAKGLFPPPPQLLPPNKGVTDDAVGETFWKVKNGIRLTGMPGFVKSLTETEMWQVSELLLTADKLPEPVAKTLQTPN
jgi:thiosulfate dehydrogenase